MEPTDYAAACDQVAQAFIAAFPAYLERRLAVVAPQTDIAEAARQGTEWLQGEITQWARLSPGEQGRGPLQIFQTALAFPTTALEQAGVEPLDRDPGAARALPGDSYGLAPASSRDIGEAAWKAHVAWGVAKARLVTAAVPKGSPQSAFIVAAVTMNQADRAAIHLVATERGVAVRHWRNPGAIHAGLEAEIPRWAVVDAGHAAADEAVQLLSDAGSRVAVYDTSPDDIATARWMALGAFSVLPREKLAAVLESWLPLPS